MTRKNRWEGQGIRRYHLSNSFQLLIISPMHMLLHLLYLTLWISFQGINLYLLVMQLHCSLLQTNCKFTNITHSNILARKIDKHLQKHSPSVQWITHPYKVVHHSVQWPCLQEKEVAELVQNAFFHLYSCYQTARTYFCTKQEFPAVI